MNLSKIYFTKTLKFNVASIQKENVYATLICIFYSNIIIKYFLKKLMIKLYLTI